MAEERGGEMTVPMEGLLKNVNSQYKLVLVAAQRANALSGGAPPLVVTKSKKIVAVALEEIEKGKVHYEETKDTKAKKS